MKATPETRPPDPSSASAPRQIKKLLWLWKNTGLRNLIAYYVAHEPEIFLEGPCLVLPDGAGLEALPPSELFLLVKCTGFQYHDWLEHYLSWQGIKHAFVGRFWGYGQLARQIYHLDPRGGDIDSWLWLAVLQTIAPAQWDQVELWNLPVLAGTSDFKRMLRRRMGFKFYRVCYRGSNYTVTINPVHIPDAENAPRERSLLRAYLHT